MHQQSEQERCTCHQNTIDGAGLLIVILQCLQHAGHHLVLQIAGQPALEEASMHFGAVPGPVPASLRRVNGLPCLQTCYSWNVDSPPC